MYPDRGPLASENSNQMIRFNLFRFLSGKKGQFHLSRKSYRKFHSNGKRSGFFRIEGFASKRSPLSPPPPPSLVLFALAPFSASPECENSFSRPDTSFGSYGNACYAGKSFDQWQFLYYAYGHQKLGKRDHGVQGVFRVYCIVIYGQGNQFST